MLRPLLAILVLTLALQPAHAQTVRPGIETASHGARAEVMRADRKDDVLTIELRFNAIKEPFGGEIIYDDLDPAGVHVEADGQQWPLLDTDKAAPASLRLNFSYDLSKTPRVGQWKAQFQAPPAGISSVTLVVPGLDPITDIALRDR